MDWGLGHATRCIPVVRYLLEKGHTVVIAASGASAEVLRSNFPRLEILALPGYGITYSRDGKSFAARIFAQIPKIQSAIRRERKWLTAEHARQPFDLVISDNRYGLKIKGINCVVMTHQLQIITGFGKWADAIMRRMHYRILEKFDACWIVDHRDADAMGGTLSHPHRLPVNARYIGTLSQLRRVADRDAINESEILMLLSGPEPTRTILEEKLTAQAALLPQWPFRIVAGNPSGAAPAHLPAHIAYHTHLNADALAHALQKAQLVICRSGYSTLMDLALFGKKALLIPTPGQPEQEYLARHSAGSGRFITRRQGHVNLAADIPAAFNSDGFPKQNGSDHLREMKAEIDDTLSRIK